MRTSSILAALIVALAFGSPTVQAQSRRRST